MDDVAHAASPFDRMAFGERATALAVLRAVAEDLVATGRALWSPQSLDTALFAGLADDEIVTAHLGADAVGTMLVTRVDARFWPDAAPATSRFVHKLAVMPAHRGRGFGHALLGIAVGLARAGGAHWLRLDCAADRPALRALYESFGFVCVDERVVGSFATAWYELRLR